MARKIRLEYADAVYHVMARENQGRRIYADDLDRQLWLETLAEGGLAALGMEGLDLRQQVKGMEEKEVLACWLSRRTTVRRRRVSEPLGMGDESRVTKAIRRVKQGTEPSLARLKRQIEERAGRAAPS